MLLSWIFPHAVSLLVQLLSLFVFFVGEVLFVVYVVSVAVSIVAISIVLLLVLAWFLLLDLMLVWQLFVAVVFAASSLDSQKWLMQ